MSNEETYLPKQLSGEVSDHADSLIADEMLREEIRRQLPPKKKKSGLLPFLNSAFALWLLSAIFITGIGTA